MRKTSLLLACGGLIGGAFVALTTTGWMPRAATAFLLVLAASIGMAVVRGLIITRIDTTCGNDTGLFAFALYALACLLAIGVATVAAAFIPHTGMVTLCACLGVALAGTLTALLHG